MAQLIVVKFFRVDGSPWGFRLHGGKDFGTPLTVQKVNGGSLAEEAGLIAGDAVIKVNNTDMLNLRHKDAQDIIVRSGNSFELTVQRGGSTWRPNVSPTTASIPAPQPSAPAACISPITRTSLAATKQDASLISSGHNLTPKPFVNGRSEGPIKSIVNNQYNSPVGMYSEETIAETLSAQAEVLAGGVLGVNFKKNEKNYNALNSEVFKMVQEADNEPRSPEPAEPVPMSSVITRLSPVTAGLRSVSAPETRSSLPTPKTSLPPGQNICADCERLIVGLFVRIKEKNLHVECFKCSTCGTALKNVGYYNINNKLYCDIHAKLVARQQAPCDLTPVAIQPGDKAPGSTMSVGLAKLGGSAPLSPPLSSHGSPQLSTARNRELGGNLCAPQKGPSLRHLASYCAINGYDTLTTGTFAYGGRDCGTAQQSCSDETYTSTITIRTGNETCVTNDVSGPNSFGGSSGVAPNSFTVPPSSSSGSNIRPQSQNATDADYYDEIERQVDESSGAPCRQHNHELRPLSSCSLVKRKSPIWPPVTAIEDITYPTASPIWIDPNPVLEKRLHNITCGKRTTFQGSVRYRCKSHSSSCCCGYEPREYEQYLSSPQGNDRETSMDRADCSQPFYRKVDKAEARRECRTPINTPRTGSADGLRRSLTPTRISQPVPKPWVATVTSGTYRHVEPPAEPSITRVCQEMCHCQIISGKASVPQVLDREQQHAYREVCCKSCEATASPYWVCSKYPGSPERERQSVSNDAKNEVIDLSKVVPPDVAVCPKGFENQHNLFTETMEKEVGDIHIKKTTIYEKTVELLSPDRARSLELEEQAADESNKPSQISLDEKTALRSSETLDREVENISNRTTVTESAETLSTAIVTAQLIDNARKEEEERRSANEKICCEVNERLHRQERDTLEPLRHYEDVRTCYNIENPRQKIEETRKLEEFHCCEDYARETDKPELSEECHDKFIQEIKIQESFQQAKDKRHQSLRDQAEEYHCLREQEVPEKRQSLQERRLGSKFRKTTTESGERLAEQQQQHQGTYPKKHVQFVALSEASVKASPPTTIGNSTAKEWKSEMVKALTTASERPYSPFDGVSCHQQEGSETIGKTVYSAQIIYDNTCRPREELVGWPTYQAERIVPPFQAALMTAPDRPYTPLGRENGGGFDTTICVDRSQTPVNLVTSEGYCYPAEILYTDDKTREAQSRERKLKKVGRPQPLPIPPQDHRLRDSSVSPAPSLSRPGTPKDRFIKAELKKPGSIPSYQRFLVSNQHDAIELHPVVLSRSSTPNRSRSPVHKTPSELPECFTRAQEPRIRESPTLSNRTLASGGPEATPMLDDQKEVSYHMNEESSASHRSEAYHGMQRSCYSDVFRSDDGPNVCTSPSVEENRRSEQNSSITLSRQDWNDSTVSCGIGNVNRVKPTLTCPLAHSSGSERFPKTGVRVLPPCPLPVTLSQSYDTRRYNHKQCRTGSGCFTVEHGHDRSSSNSGLMVMSCKTTSQLGSVTGNVVIPGKECENTSCSRPGICVTPTTARSTVCVSPSSREKTAGNCAQLSSRPRYGPCIIDVGNYPASGVSMAACKDGFICAAPCSIPGYAPVQSSKPIVGSFCSKAELPFPQIPLPEGGDESVNLCDSGPFKSQPTCLEQDISDFCLANVQSFQPIRETRTNLSNQLTRLTVRRNNQHANNLFKHGAQSQPLTQCSITETECQTKTQCGIQIPEPNCNTQKTVDPPNLSSQPNLGNGVTGPVTDGRSGKFAGSSAPTRGRGILNQASGPGSRQPLCGHCNSYVRGPFITALGQIWCPEHFVCSNSHCGRALQDIGFVEDKGGLHCEYCFERLIAPACNKCNSKIKGDCLNAIGKHFHPECFNCSYCGKLFENSPFFVEEGLPYCQADWNELFTTKCYACGFPVEAGDRWVEALNNNYHSQCFNCTMCKKNLEGQSFYAKGGRPFCKNHAR